MLYRVLCSIMIMSMWLGHLSIAKAQDRQPHILFRHDLGTPLDSSPMIYQNILVLGADDYSVYAFDRHTGQELWKYKTGGKVWGSASIDSSCVYIGSSDGKVYCFSRTNGRIVWATALLKPLWFYGGDLIEASNLS